MAKAKLLGFDKTDQHKTDVTIINKPLPYPTKELEMSVEAWVEKWSPKEIVNTFFDEIGGKRTYERVKQFADDEHEPPSKATKVRRRIFQLFWIRYSLLKSTPSWFSYRLSKI